MKKANDGYSIWPVYYGDEVKYRVVKFLSSEVAYERQFRSRDEADKYVIDVQQREKADAMIDEGSPVHPTEHDESDDLEAAKRTVSQQMMDELEPIQSEMDYSGAFESDIKE